MTLVRFRLDLADGLAVGPGKIQLLELLREHGSISAAARAMDISYRQAWLLLNELNSGFGERVFDTATGGSQGGGARLTTFGRKLIERYRGLERSIEQLAQEVFPEGLRNVNSTQSRKGTRRQGPTRHSRLLTRAKRRP